MSARLTLVPSIVCKSDACAFIVILKDVCRSLVEKMRDNFERRTLCCQCVEESNAKALRTEVNECLRRQISYNGTTLAHGSCHDLRHRESHCTHFVFQRSVKLHVLTHSSS